MYATISKLHRNPITKNLVSINKILLNRKKFHKRQ